jgi:hypothetical protein
VVPVVDDHEQFPGNAGDLQQLDDRIRHIQPRRSGHVA